MTTESTERATDPVSALIVAAGRGLRAGGGIPKQFRPLRGRAILEHTLQAFLDHPRVGEVVLVHHPDDADRVAEVLARLGAQVTTVHGAETRDGSVRAGLAAVTGETVLIHDAARPLVSQDVIDGVIAALAGHDGAAPALAVTDALWRGGETVDTAAPRDGLWRAQTPQGFHTAAIRAAHAARPDDAPAAADDVEVALAHGLSVAITRGEERNLKITTPDDFTRTEIFMGTDMPDIRTGNGYDVHRFAPGDRVILCGVEIPHDRALKGHSDADVGLHTVTDAIYGALAEGDIGTHFPPSDPQWKGAASHVFLTHAVDLAAAKGFTITHADLTLICERPKIGPHAAAMRAELARLLRVETERVSVKATTTERLGFTGREEGIAAMATVTLVRP